MSSPERTWPSPDRELFESYVELVEDEISNLAHALRIDAREEVIRAGFRVRRFLRGLLIARDRLQPTTKEDALSVTVLCRRGHDVISTHLGDSAVAREVTTTTDAIPSQVVHSVLLRVCDALDERDDPSPN